MKYLPLIFLLMSCQPKTTTQVTGKVLRVETDMSYILFKGGHVEKLHGYYAEPGMDILCTVSSNGDKIYYFTLRDCIVLPPVAPEKPEFGQKQRLLIEKPL